MAEDDFVDELVALWKRERPDLDLGAVATVGRVARLHAYLLRAVEATFAAHGLQVGEFDVLAALRRVGPPHAIKPSVLARMMLLSPAGMTSRLDRLEALGFVERRPDPDDRRSSSVVLTPNGSDVIESAMRDHAANDARLVAPLTAAERRTFDDLLRKLLVQFESETPPA